MMTIKEKERTLLRYRSSASDGVMRLPLLTDSTVISSSGRYGRSGQLLIDDDESVTSIGPEAQKFGKR